MKAFLIPITTLMTVFLGTAFAASQATPRTPSSLPDLTAVAQVEIRAADGAVVLAGQFGAATTEDDETERDAPLSGVGTASGASGTAEFEAIARGNQTERELEIDVEGLPANTSFNVVIDGQVVATFTTDSDGEAEIEWKDVK
jgi:hypothetical protein